MKKLLLLASIWVIVSQTSYAITFGEASPKIAPEPSAMALSMLGVLAGLAFWIRRR